MTENTNTSPKVRVESMEEIVFLNRNKEYGAYQLRKRYKKYVLIAFLCAFLILGGAIAKPLIEAYQLKGKYAKKMEKKVKMEMEKLDQDAPPPPPPPPPPPAAIEQQVKFVAPVVVDTVKEEVTLMTADEAKEITAEAPPEEIKVEESAPKEIEQVEEVFTIVEENATFQGGDLNNFRNWVASNFVYPQSCAEAGISGRVIIQFAVNSKGKVCDARVLRGVHPELDKEAIRVILSSPDWTPGKQGGRSVKQQFVLPIMFQLQ